MKKELVIQVDVDGVLADYVYGFRRVAASRYGSRIAVYGQREQQEWAVCHAGDRPGRALLAGAAAAGVAARAA
jgi:hypothetical protein